MPTRRPAFTPSTRLASVSLSISGRFGSRERLPCPAGEQKEYKEVEKIVHKEVIKEVTVGVSEEELSKVSDRVEINRCASWKRNAIEQTQRWGQSRVDGVESTRHRAHAVTETTSRHSMSTQVHAEAERKKEEIRERAERQLAAELERQAATEEERERLRADLVRQESERKNASQRKRQLAAKLKGMENKLLKGGQLLDKAATQEAELRKAKQELTRKQEAERLMANAMRDLGVPRCCGAFTPSTRLVSISQ